MTNRWLKLLSIFVSLALIINLLPLQALASEIDETPQLPLSTLPEDGSSGSTTGYQRLDTATVVEEDTSRRGEYYKEFVLNNGLRLAAVYADPVHFDEDGQWKDIDNTLKAVDIKGISGYTNTAGVWQVYFPQQLTGSNAISVTKDGYTVSFGMAGELTNSGNIAVASIGASSDILAVSSVRSSAAQIRAVDLTEQKAAAQYEQTVLEKHHSKLAYASVYDNTEIVYDLTGNRLKESIMISKYDASLWGYRYNLNTGGLIPVLLEDNTIELRHPETAEVIMTMPAPFMVDANDEYSYDVDVSLVQKNGGYLLSYYVPRAWLASSDRVWPVVLDPVVDANNVKSNIQDISVTETVVDPNSETTLRIGYKPGVGAMHAYLRYKTLPALPSSAVIINVRLTMTKTTTSTVGAPIEVHKVNSYWVPGNITSWSNKPAYNSTVEDVVTVQNPQAYTWDITNIALDWYSNTTYSITNNTGLMFKASESVETADANNYQRLSSSDGSAVPQLQITYQDTAGLEDYWDYSSVSAGRAGTGYIHNHSGNLVWVHNDMGFDGNRMPVSISHVYNPSLSTSNEYGLGYSWQTNYNQTIKKVDGVDSYIWTDGDGTPHYFYSTGTGVYQDEDNLHLTLSVTTDKYTLTDQYGNTSEFEKIVNGTNQEARLTKQTNNQATNSSVNISYSDQSGKRISTITDGVGRVYAFVYSGDLLDKIEYKPSGNTVRYTVDFNHTNSQLTSVKYADNKESFYTYNTKNLLTKVQNIDGYSINFTYGTTGAGKPRRVLTVTEKDISESNETLTGKQTSFTYGLCSTKVTTREETDAQEAQYQVYHFDKWSNTVSVYDEEGRAVVSKYKPVLQPGDPTHLVTATSTQQITVINLLSDSSFENGTLWSNIVNPMQEIVTSEAYLGQKSLKFRTNEAKGITSPGIQAEEGGIYTFSAYIKSPLLEQVRLEIVLGTTVVKTEEKPVNTGWSRISISCRNDAGSLQQMYVRITGVSSNEGTVYIDCVQFEKDRTENRYNLLQNTDFANDTNWVGLSSSGNPTTASVQNSAFTQLNDKALKVIGKDGVKTAVSQTVNIEKSAKKFVVSGWGKIQSQPTYEKTDRTIGLQVTIKYDNGHEEKTTIPFISGNGADWQYVAAEIDTRKVEENDEGLRVLTCVSIKVEIVCDNVACTAYFDGIGLYADSFGESYEYDVFGNVQSVQDVLGNKTQYTYHDNGADLLLVNTPTKTQTVYIYDNWHNVKSAIQYEPDGNMSPTVVTSTTHYTYNTYGNTTQVAVISGNEARVTSAAYTESGNYLTHTIDEAGQVTSYGYVEETGVLWWIRYPNDTPETMTYYTYDSMFRLFMVQSGSQCALYTYDNDQIQGISSQSTNYALSHGDFGQRKTVKAGSYTLATYEYTNDTDRYLEKLYYGEKSSSGTNADYVHYTYDEKGRVIAEEYHENGSGSVDSGTYYEYNDKGQVAKVTNSKTGTSWIYEYDELGRVQRWQEKDGNGNESYAAEYIYDGFGNVTDITDWINGEALGPTYRYDSHNRPSWSQSSSSGTTIYNYNDYGQLTRQSTDYMAFSGSREYTYRSVGSTAINGQGYSKVTSQISGLRINVRAREDEYLSVFADYQYTYDNNGNIASVTTNGKTTTYTYDSHNQLIREANEAAGEIWEWAYDSAGNITSKTIYDYQTEGLAGIITYNYALSTDSNNRWNDRLTSYGATAITYDPIGNPLTIGEWECTWQKGRQLASMSRSGENWVYTYDSNGLLTKKTDTVSGKTCKYIYSGGQLRYMYDDGYSMVFDYDANGFPLSVTCNDATYFYITNLQGDVIAIIDQYGCWIAKYEYDAWGNQLWREFNPNSYFDVNIASINPLRYRGYVYDRHTGLYYLQTRYYNPEWGRFINADGLVATGQGLTGNNMFAYCGNNPVSRADNSGEFWVTAVLISALVAGAISAVADAAIQAVTTGEVDAGQVLIAGVSGAISGACALIPGGAFLTTAISVGVNAALTGGSYVVNQLRKGEAIDKTDFWVNVGIGAISGAAGNLFRFSSTGAIRNAGKTLVNKGMQKMTNGVLNSATSTIKRGFQYIDRGIPMIYQYAARAGVNSGFGSTTGCVINGIYSLIG